MTDVEIQKPRLSREFIDYHAFGMVRALQDAGHLAYLVGGCVRDLLSGVIPKDFDIGTSAQPPQIKRLINFSFIIGRRFRLVLAKRGEKQYEIATFRREPAPDEFPEGVPFGDNIFGTPEQDAHRRDFTVNALFYDPSKDQIIDYIDGKKDVDGHLIKMIGDPKKRLAEDPIRILRALRLSHKLKFRLESELRSQMSEMSPTLTLAVLPRRREEILKLLRLHDPVRAFFEGYDLGLWKNMAPHFHDGFDTSAGADFIEDRLRKLDSRLVDPADTALLMGTLILGWVRSKMEMKPDEPMSVSIVNKCATLEKLCKDELGMHNWEIGRVQAALSMQKLLEDTEGFATRGRRRKNSMLLNEAFPLAVDLAYLDGVLDPAKLDFWSSELDLVKDEQAALSPQPHRPRPQGNRSRRPRRRKPRA